MNPLPPLNIPAILRQHGLQPNKSLGQNFLIDEAALAKIAGAAGIVSEDSVLEIGPGLGSLTRHLAMAARQVTAVELDAHLIPALNEVLSGFKNVVVLHGDILGMDPAALMPAPGYLVVANIPYYITSALVRHLLEARCAPRRIVLTMQQEVADRICAQAGEMSLLALGVQVYGLPQVVARIPAGAFYPPPKVDSAVIRVEIRPEPYIQEDWLDSFFRLAKAGFSQKRKTLRNTLAGGMRWSKNQSTALLTAAGIDPMRRAETLSLDEWKNLVQVWQEKQIDQAP